jgi:beta-exotoxin I transport system permease protein
LGGGDYGTITGWFRSEIGAIYGPLVIGAVAVTGASAATAGEEEERILAMVLAHPIRRSQLIASKAAAIGEVVVVIAFATWAGLLVGFALAGGGFTIGHTTALAVQLAFFGFATGDPLTRGVYMPGIIVLGVTTLALTVLAMARIERRDLRA